MKEYVKIIKRFEGREFTEQDQDIMLDLFWKGYLSVSCSDLLHKIVSEFMGSSDVSSIEEEQ